MKLFAKKENPAIAELRRAVAQNESDETWRTALYQKAVDLERAYDSARNALSATPSDSAVEVLVAAGRAMADAPALRTAHAAVAATLGQAAIARAVPALLAALAAVEKALQAKIAEVEEFQSKASETLGVPLMGGEAVRTLNADIEACQSWTKRISGIAASPDSAANFATVNPTIQEATAFVFDHV